MNRKQFLHGNLEGIDIDIEISLKEYGLAWIEQGDEILFYYGINHNDTDYTRFDFCVLPKDLDVLDEYDWADFEDIYRYTGITIDDWKDFPLSQKIFDLVNYYGHENIFGSSYWEGLTYQGIWFPSKN